MKILILGISGLIGSSVFRELSKEKDLEAYGTIRNYRFKNFFELKYQKYIVSDFDILKSEILENLYEKIKPDYIINCIGITKHNPEIKNFNKTIKINSILPHKINLFLKNKKTRLIHISTDCVFSGKKGCYTEEDFRDAQDIYGKSKSIGEDLDGDSIILRTSTIGHELFYRGGLLEWFLKSNIECDGYKKAFFSGFPSIYIGKIIKNHIINRHLEGGIYNVSSERINKHNLLKVIKTIYNKKIKIIPNNKFKIDRSLDGTKFFKATGFLADDWEKMIKKMYNNYREIHV